MSMRAQPLRAEQERICVAFEILPKEFVTLGSPAN
jgi:hypothetical protein